MNRDVGVVIATTESNIVNIADLRRWNGELDQLDREEASVKAELGGKCRAIAERRKKVFKIAKEAGVPVHELKIVRKQKKLAAQIAELQEEIEEDQRPVAEVIADHLGAFVDLPLGRAAVDAALRRHEEDAKTGPVADRLDDLTSDEDGF